MVGCEWSYSTCPTDILLTLFGVHVPAAGIYKQFCLVRKGVSTTWLEMSLWFRAPSWWGMCSVSLCMCECKNGLLPACFALLNIKVSDVPFKNSGLLGLAQEIKIKVLQSCLNSTVTSLKIGFHNYLIRVCLWQWSVNNVCLKRNKNTHRSTLMEQF